MAIAQNGTEVLDRHDRTGSRAQTQCPETTLECSDIPTVPVQHKHQSMVMDGVEPHSPSMFMNNTIHGHASMDDVASQPQKVLDPHGKRTRENVEEKVSAERAIKFAHFPSSEDGSDEMLGSQTED